MLKHGILGLLNHSDKTGYEILEVFNDSLNFFWHANTSQIYRELQTIKNKGWATDKLVKQEKRPDKKVFSITELGKKELLDWLEAPNYGNENNGLLLKIFFFGELPKDIAINKLLKLKQTYENNLKKHMVMHELSIKYEKKTNNSYKAEFWKMNSDFVQKQDQMIIDWLNECIQRLSTGDYYENSGN